MKWGSYLAKRRYLILAAILGFILFINFVFYFTNPTQIVSFIGIENTYAIVFVLAAIGGLSSITGPALFATVATFAAGGSDPLLLGIVSGIGLFISDSIFYHLFLFGRKALPEAWEPWVKRLQKRVDRLPSWAVLSLSYIYLGLTPFPNDILMFVLGISGYPYKKIAPVLLAGALTLTPITAYFGGLFYPGL